MQFQMLQCRERFEQFAQSANGCRFGFYGKRTRTFFWFTLVKIDRELHRAMPP